MQEQYPTQFDFRETPLFHFLKNRRKAGKTKVMCAGQSVVEVDLREFPVEQVTQKLISKGVFTPEVLAEIALQGIDFQQEAG